MRGVATHGDYRDVQPLAQQAKDREPGLAVITPLILDRQGSRPFQIGDPLETQASIRDVPGILQRVEG